MILISGGAGFIGSHLIDYILKEWRGREVICIDNFNTFYDPQLKRKNISSHVKNHLFHLEEGDIRDISFLERIFDHYPVEEVVHLAAMAGVRPSIRDPFLYYEVNVEGTLNLLEFCRKKGVKNFIFGSSSSVYGHNQKLPFNEEDKVESPISPYAATKRAGELMCYTYHHLYGMNVTCLRLFTVYGPRQRPEMAIHKFTRLISKGEEVPIYGDGKSKRDYTYISDIIQGIGAALRKKYPFDIFNLGDSKAISLMDLVHIIGKNLGKKARIKRLPDQPGDVPVTLADIGKAEKLLGYNVQIEIEEGIRRFVDWFKEAFL